MDRLERRAVEVLAGRRAEVERLQAFALGNEPLVMHIQGIPGIGKTHLLNALAASVGKKGISVVRVDARWCEPSPAALCRAISKEIGGSESEDSVIVAKSLSDVAKRSLLVLDSYESFRLLDSWLRQVFLPALGDGVRTILSSREAPRPAWRIDPEWRGLFDSMVLETFSPEVALEYLTAQGVPESSARELNRVAHGHPLALSLGLALYSAGGQVRGTAARHHQVLEHMAGLFLEDVDSKTKQIVEAACLVRTATAPLLSAMLPDIPTDEALYRLRLLPFVSAGPHGLLVHEAVRGPVTAALKSRDPVRYQAYRRAASQVAREQYRQAPRAGLWRCTADVLYLLENETLREGFFPTAESAVSVEPARADDGPAITAIVRKFDGSQSREALEQWWRYHPESFFVVRDEQGGVQGFYVAIVASRVHKNVIAKDPLAASWTRDLPRSEDRAATLWIRRSLDRDTGEGPSSGQAACWLDIKRTYLELRPRLRWIYTCYCEAEFYRRSFEQLGFRMMDEGRPLIDRAMQHTFRLDMGLDSVDGWLGNLLAQETGTATEDAERYAPLLDEKARELVVNGNRVGLTPLEFGVFAYLVARPNRAVARYELVEAVWGYGKEASTSNVVETVVRSVRQKLGAHRNTLETVRGVGYRYRPTT
ncbi:MAG TPA: winged helix-turn-helix domain-containing protein [Candidatus Sulfotelmatobacter sp.]|nr:winged helix-turn-helix domain-containing protein [Candidatus Sulfotelmatobacter sp.]